MNENTTSSTRNDLANDEARNQVADLIMDARSVEEVTRARRARDKWMREHPNDLLMLDISGGLEHIARHLGLPEYKGWDIDEHSN